MAIDMTDKTIDEYNRKALEESGQNPSMNIPDNRSEKATENMTEAAREDSARVVPSEKPNIKKEEIKEHVAPEITNTTNAVDPTTGHVAPENAPADPTIPNQNGAPQQGQTLTPPERPDIPMVLADSNFRGEKESFFKKGFLKELNRKIDEALKGNTPEEMAMNMTLATFTLLFDMLTAYLEHNMEQRDKVAKEYKDGIKAFERDMHVYQQHKDLTVWATLANNPEFMQKFGGKALTEDVKKEAKAYMKEHPELVKAVADSYSFLTQHECTPKMVHEQIDKTFASNTDTQDLAMLKNRGLNNPMIKDAVDNGAKKTVYDNQMVVYKAQLQQQQQNRQILNNARGNGNTQQQTQQTQQTQQPREQETR